MCLRSCYQVVSFLNNANKAFARLRIKIPILTSEEVATLPSAEKVTSAVSSLTGLRGGAATCSSGAVCGASCGSCGVPTVQWMAKMIRDKMPSGRRPSKVEEEEEEEEDEEEV